MVFINFELKQLLRWIARFEWKSWTCLQTLYVQVVPRCFLFGADNFQKICPSAHLFIDQPPYSNVYFGLRSPTLLHLSFSNESCPIDNHSAVAPEFVYFWCDVVDAEPRQLPTVFRFSLFCCPHTAGGAPFLCTSSPFYHPKRFIFVWKFLVAMKKVSIEFLWGCSSVLPKLSFRPRFLWEFLGFFRIL